jgi:hypothetical protein
MRARVPALTALLTFSLLVPTALCAQFLPPTPEELKMTEDPKAPGAAAVYLNISEDDNDPTHYRAFYARIKVLTEKGKELSTVDLPYVRGDWKITDIKARTIHADGTIIPLEGKPEDLMTSKSGDRQIARKVFNLPKVEIGSILEYRYQIRYDDNHFSSPEWEIQKKYFVHKAHYSFIPFKSYQPGPKGNEGTNMYLVGPDGKPITSLIWWTNLPKGYTVKTDVGGHYTVDVEDIPAIPDEEWMPPIQSFLYRVFFYYKAAYNANDFWKETSKDWAKNINRFAESGGGIRDAVAQIVSPTDADIDKAKKLYKAVQALDNTDYSRRKSESEMKDLKIKAPKHAEDVWKQKSGDSDSIAMLYLAMLHAAGLKAFPAQVVNRNRGTFDLSYMELSQVDDIIVDLYAGPNPILLDPGEKLCPFGQLNWRHSGARGLAESEAGPSILVTPEQSFKDNILTRTGDLTLDAHGALTGKLQFTMIGQEALRWRQFGLRNDPDELKKSFDRSLESVVPAGVEAHVDHFIGLDTPDTNLLAIINIQGKLGTATSKRLLLPGFFFETRGSHPFVDQAVRLEPVDMQYGEQVADQVNYHLPPGYTVEAAPKEADIPWTGHAVYIAKTASSPGLFIVARRLARAFSQAKPEEYQDLRGFYQKIAAADQQQLVLAAPASGGTSGGN